MSDQLPFKRLEVCDVFTPTKIAVFERPHEADEIVVINIGREEFHCDAGTLKVIGDVMVGMPPRANAPGGAGS